MLRKAVQDLLLGPSQIFNNGDWLEKLWFRKLKRSCYFAYKKFYERDFINFVEKNKGLMAHGHIIDVGANIGFTANLFSKHTSKPFFVYAFEPEKWNFKILEESIKKNNLSNVKAISLALGETDSRKTFWINPKNSADHRVLSATQSRNQNETVEIITKNFDSYWEQQGFERISLIKMDIQGYELFALKGMEKSLQKYRPLILIELDNEKLKDHGHSVEDIYSLLSSLGYTAHKISHKGSLQSITKTELDSLLIQNEYLDIIFKTN
ncbi:MAG: FkbM family methyltransferase [Proteobacteria bacterium]|nr:FkbM family methyltransferase [Pseudomonadota bacterium]